MFLGTWLLPDGLKQLHTTTELDLPSTVSEIIHEVCDSIWYCLKLIVLPQPSTDKWLTIAHYFRDLWNIPNCIYALDGKHVIRAPKNSGTTFLNYKKTFSIVLLVLKSLKNNGLNLPDDQSIMPFGESMMQFVFVRDQAFLLRHYQFNATLNWLTR